MKRTILHGYAEEQESCIEYVIPHDFLLSTPEYFTGRQSLLSSLSLRKRLGWPFPVVIYGVFLNEQGESFCNSFESDSKFDYFLLNLNLPCEMDLDRQRYLHYFEQYSDPSSSSYKSLFFDKKMKAEKSGYGRLVFSVGVWTDDGIINEQMIPYGDSFEELASATLKAFYDAFKIYNGSPELLKFYLESIFGNEELVDDSKKPTVLTNRSIIDAVFDQDDGERRLNDPDGLGTFPIVLNEALNLYLALTRGSHAMLSVVFRIDFNENHILVDFDNFLKIMQRLHQSGDQVVFDISGKEIEHVDNYTEGRTSFAVQRTDYMKSLLSVYVIK